MHQIHERLVAQEYPNCSTLARDLEVNRRTLLRDIEFMKDRLHLPIEYDDRKYGFHYTRKVDAFPLVTLNESEIFALLVADKAVAQYRGTPFHGPLEAAFRRITRQLEGGQSYGLSGLDQILSFRPFAPADTELETFQILTRGLRERRVVEFEYRNLGAERTQRRRVRPYHLTCIDNLWYLIAHDNDRSALRNFVLTRLSDPVLTRAQFERPGDFDANEYLRGNLSAFRGGEDFEVVIELDRWGTDLVEGRRWHPTQELTKLPGGKGSRLRLRLNSIEEVERLVLSWGSHATVIRPQELRTRLSATGAFLIARYGSGADAGSETAGSHGSAPK